MILKNYYELLKIDSNSNLETIKKAFRKEIALYHPEKNTSPEANAIFEDLIEGFDILSHPEKRKAYDKMLQESLNQKQLVVIEPKAEETYQKWKKEAKKKSKKYKSSTLEDLLLLDLFFVSGGLFEGLFDDVGDILGDVFDLF